MRACLLMIIVLILAVMFMPRIQPNTSQYLPNVQKDFFGREKDIETLIDIVDFSNDTFYFINIVGPPGFDKSDLAISIGHQMLARRTEVYYIDLNDFPDKSLKQILAKNILKKESDGNDGYGMKEVTFHNLLNWVRKRTSNCLIILDNCDNILRSHKEDFHESINKLLTAGNSLKLLTTSRESTFHSDANYKHEVLPVNIESAFKILDFKNLFLNKDDKLAIVRLTGRVPLALKIVRALLYNNMYSPAEVIKNLEKQPINTLSPPELQSSMRLNSSISCSFNYLDRNVQKAGRYLSLFPGSFDQQNAVGVLHKISKSDEIINPILSLKQLVKLSLLKYYAKLNRYHHYKLIRDYFNTQSTIKEKINFGRGIRSYYSLQLCKLVNKFRESPRSSLHMLDLDRSQIQLWMSFINSDILVLKQPKFDRDSANCFLKAVKIKFINCCFTPQEIIGVLFSFTTSFPNSVRENLKYNNTKNAASDFTLYVGLVIQLSDMLQSNKRTKEALKLIKYSSTIIDTLCEFLDTEKSCRRFYSYLLRYYGDKFDATTAKLYHIKFLENSLAYHQINGNAIITAKHNWYTIAISYLNLKKYRKAKIYFEKALYDEHFEYSISKRLFMLLWLQKTFRDSVNVNQIKNDLIQCYDYLLKLSTAELYREKTYLIQDYQDYLKSIGEHSKSYAIQEKWIKAMEEIGVESSMQQIKHAKGTALKLFDEGHYSRSLNVVKHILSVIDKNQTEEFITFYFLKGIILHNMNNFTQSEIVLKTAAEHILSCNMTLNNGFSQICWMLTFLLHNFEYIHDCYTLTILNSDYFYAETILYLFLKSPFNYVSVKSPMRWKKVTISNKFFPFLWRPSDHPHHKDIESDEASIFKPDLTTVIISTALENVFSIALHCFIASLFHCFDGIEYIASFL